MQRRSFSNFGGLRKTTRAKSLLSFRRPTLAEKLCKLAQQAPHLLVAVELLVDQLLRSLRE